MLLFTVLPFLAAVLAAPLEEHAKFRRSIGPAISNSYIVVLKSHASVKQSLKRLNTVVPGASEKIQSWEVINGYSAQLTDTALQHILNDPDVDFVEQDSTVHCYSPSIDDLAPAHEDADTLEKRSDLSARALGSGVDIYVLASGVRTTHTSFGTRASSGAVFGGYPVADGNGQGTYSASLAAGTGFGPATQANIISVKVLSDTGSGTNANIISGVNWVTSNVATTGRPGVAIACFGGSVSTALDNAISSSIASGVHWVFAAGNSNSNVANFSPARVAAGITVGATTAANAKAAFSNFGPLLDVWSSGATLTGAWYTSDTATITLSGTCGPASRVAGFLAVAISNSGNRSPAALQADLKANAVADVTGVPSGTSNLRAVQW